MPEVGIFFSGGGFSNHFDRPNYQKFEVGNYVDSIGNKHEGLYAFVLPFLLAESIKAMLFMQTFGPWRPRYRPEIVRIRLHLAWRAPFNGNYRMLDKCASFTLSLRSALDIFENPG